MTYEIKNTDFGPRFHDADRDEDLTLEDVLVLLNDRRRLAELVTANERVSKEYLQQETRRADDNGRHASKMECRFMDEQRHRVYYQNIVYDVCNRLDAVLGGKTVCGTADSPTTQVVERLAEVIERGRGEPHEDPRRTAYVAGLERAAARLLAAHDKVQSCASPSDLVCDGDGAPNALHHVHTNSGIWDADNGEAAGRGCEWCHAVRALRNAVDGTAVEDMVTRAFHDGAMATLEDELRAAHDEVGRLTEEVEYLRTTQRNLEDAWVSWARGLTGLVGPTYTDADLRRAVDVKMAQDREELMSTIRHMRDKLTRVAELVPPYTESVDGRKIAAVVMEQLPPHDPLAVEIERANMFREIDDLLQDRGAWVGGRLDSVKALLNQCDGMRTLLLGLDRWIDDNRQAVHSWVATDEEDER